MDETIFKDLCIQLWMRRKGWMLSSPGHGWNSWHIITGEGHVFPVDRESLLLKYQADPMSADEIAIEHRRATFAATNRPPEPGSSL